MKFFPAATLLSYLNLIRQNRNYRLYMMSVICSHMGHWFVYIASVIVVERLSESATALGKMVITHSVPKILLTPVGGVLADSYDRKNLLITFDIIAGFAVLGNVVVVRSESLALFYIVSTIRSAIHALYEPATRSLVPLLVDGEDLKRAATLNGVVWSSMLMIGGILSGKVSAALGVQLCYVVDSATYFMSAFVVSQLKGDFSVAYGDSTINESSEKNDTLNKKKFIQQIRTKTSQVILPIQSFVKMSKEVFQYLVICGFGGVLFLQPSASTVWGAASVLNPSYARIDGDEAETSRRLGLLTSFVGIGCLIGPILANILVNVDKPAKLQSVCIAGLVCMSIGWFGISISPTFAHVCLFTTVRTIGSGVLWIDSTLLLQKLSAEDMLGRIVAFEHSMALVGETATAYITGLLEDSGHANSEIALMASLIALTFSFLWTIYHVCGGGAANRRFNTLNDIGGQGSLEIGPLRTAPKTEFV